MKRVHAASVILGFALALSQWAVAEVHKVDQKGDKFLPETMEIKVGDSVEFHNSDPHFHSVFSLSDAKFFDLGSFPTGQTESIEFETPGTVTVECAIHPEMILNIEVKE